MFCSMSLSRDTCASLFTDALFVTARRWSQPRCPPTDRQVENEDAVYTHGGIHLVRNKNEICKRIDGSEKYSIKLDNPHSDKHCMFSGAELSVCARAHVHTDHGEGAHKEMGKDEQQFCSCDPEVTRKAKGGLWR